MPFHYESGVEIRKGDRVIFHGEPGEIEFVADPLENDAGTEWFVKEYGGGVMVLAPKRFGRAFLTKTDNAEDLVFVCRAGDNPT